MTSRSGDSLETLALLDDERASLLRSLTDLEREFNAGDLDEVDYATLKEEYTVRAADQLRRRANVEAGVSATIATAQRSRARRPWLRPAGVIATLAAALGIGVAVARFAGERIGSQGLTGSVQAAGQQRSNEIRALLIKAQQNLSSDPFTALQAYDSVLAIDPENPEAAAYGGWLLRIVSQSAKGAQRVELLKRAGERLDRAVLIAPGYPDARAFRGILRLRDQNDPVGANADFVALAALDPPPFVKQLVGSASEEAKAAVSTVPTKPNPSPSAPSTP